MKVSLPTNGSVATLNANAENGSSSLLFRKSFFPSSKIPSIGGTSIGLGKYHTIASSNNLTHLFLNAVPHRTGNNLVLITPFLIQFLISSTVKLSPARNFSIIASSNSTISSNILFLHSSALAFRFSGISSTL